MTEATDYITGLLNSKAAQRASMAAPSNVPMPLPMGVTPQVMPQEQIRPLDMFKQELSAGRPEAVAIDKFSNRVIGNDPVAKESFVQSIIDHPEEIDPNNSYQMMNAFARWSRTNANMPRQMPTQSQSAMEAYNTGDDYFKLRREQEKHISDLATADALQGKYAATAAGGGASGGVTGFVYNKTKAALEAAGVQVTPQMEMEIISAARNGLQKGSTITVNGQKIAIGEIMGATDFAQAMSAAEQQGQKNVDLTMNPQIESATVTARKIADTLSTQGISDAQAEPLMEQLDLLNEQTFDLPYANIAQVPAQFLDKYKDQTTAFDLMEQIRTNLAIPLAKALGVNPTDRDFKATLDSIFNIRSSKASRRAQIAALKKRIATRRANNPINTGIGDGNTSQRVRTYNPNTGELE